MTSHKFTVLSAEVWPTANIASNAIWKYKHLTVNAPRNSSAEITTS